MHSAQGMNVLPALSPCTLLVLCLLFLIPGVSFAAEGFGHAPAPLPGMQESSWDAWEEDQPASSSGRGLRIAAETGAGLLGSLALGLGGSLAGVGICEGLQLEKGFLACLDAVIYGLAAGIVLGTPLGVWGGGEATDGNGSLLATLAGSGLGILVSLGIIGATHGEGLESTLGFLTVAIGPSLVGSILGYELTQREKPPRLQPTLSFSSRGAVLGLGGCF